MPFSTFSNFRLNRGGLSDRLGLLRFIGAMASLAMALQWIVPVGARYIFNGGRIYYSNAPERMWPELLPWPVFSIPAWLTILTGALAIACAAAYLFSGGLEIANDIPFMGLVPMLFCAFFPWQIAALDMDPTGVVRTPGPEGYPMGWHWVISPFSLIMVVAMIAAYRRMGRIRAERRRRRGTHVAEG